MAAFMFEHVSKPVIPQRQFVSRLMRAVLLGLGMIVISLAIGMTGYLWFFPTFDWADAFVNAAMILSGMGPVGELKTEGGKLFAGCYAIFSGLVIVIATGFVLAPVFHRVLHKFHVETDKDDEKD